MITSWLHPAEWQAVWLSVKVACWCVLLDGPLGLWLGWLLARRQFWGRSLLNVLVHLPLVLPPVVVGYGMLMLLGRTGVIGRWLDETFGASIAFTPMAAVLASAVMGLPLMVRSARGAFEQVDRRLEAASVTLGHSPVSTFWRITFPLAWPGVLTGLLLCFARSLGEFGATITFAGNLAGQTRTLPLAIFTYSQTPGGDGGAIRLACVSVVLCFVALGVSEWLGRRNQLSK